MLVKICGITREEETDFLNRVKPDFAGFILYYPKSKRNLDIERARQLKSRLDPSIKTVGVVVDPQDEWIEAIEAAGFDYIQVHGHISDKGLADCKIPVIKAFNVTDMGDFERYSKNPKVAGFLMDAAIPGNGKSFDWDSLSSLPKIEKGERFILLAGGINADNIDKAMKVPGIDGLDTSSGVENDDGIGKNPDKVCDFVRRSRALMIFDRHDYTPGMKAIRKRTVRAIIKRGEKLAMQKNNAGEYKIPGGGAEGSETDLETLEREIMEETGRELIASSVSLIGYILEFRRDIFEPDKKYEVETVYYCCDVTDEQHELSLTDSEKAAGFKFVWENADEIIRSNREIIKEEWKIKDTCFLEWYRNN